MGNPKLLSIQQHLAQSHPAVKRDLWILERVDDFTRHAFQGKKRLSGRDYHEDHNLSVAQIAALEMNLALPEVCVALLHDLLEETSCTQKDIVALFEDTVLDGEEISRMVYSLSKIDSLEDEVTIISDPEYIKKLMYSVSQDLRTMVVKIADVLHNTRDLRGLPRYRQKRFAINNLEIWAWLCIRFGMGRYFREIARLSLWALDPKGFARIQRQIASLYTRNLNKIDEITQEIGHAFAQEGFQHMQIVPQMRHVHSWLLKKPSLQDLQDVQFRRFSDLVDFEIVLESENPIDCYKALGIVHGMFRAIPGEFQDYVSERKYNLYSALHTKVVHKEDTLSLRIQTKEMKTVAEDGLLYFLAKGDRPFPRFETYQDLLKTLRDEKEIDSFMGHFKDFLVPEDVAVITPKKDLVYLPRRSSAIDFAFQIHTELGLRLHSCTINGEAASIFSTLKSGDRVEVFTADAPMAKVFWQDHVRTPKARLALHTYYNKNCSQLAVQVGSALLYHAFPNAEDVADISFLNKIRVRTKEELYEKIGRGDITLEEFISGEKRARQRGFLREIPVSLLKWVSGYRETRVKIKVAPAKVVVDPQECCRVTIGRDPVVGYIKDNKVVVHDTRCKAIDAQVQERAFLVVWDMEEETCSLLTISAEDRPDIIGSITTLLIEKNINIKKISSKEEKGLPHLSLLLDIPVLDGQVLEKIRNLPGVVKATSQSVGSETA